MSPHDPTVTAAVIAVAGTATVAISGYVLTWITTRRTLMSAEKSTKLALESSEANARAAVVGEREHRLWERRTDSYLDVLAYTTHRQLVRENQARALRLDDEGERAVQAELATYKPNGSIFDLEARIRAFGTVQVIEAFVAAGKANGVYVASAQAVEQAAPGDARVAAVQARDAAVKAAEVKDEELVAVIRDEIQRMR